MTEVAVSVASKVAEYLVASIKLPFRYLWNYKSNVENLENKVKKLEGRREMVQHSIEDARRKGEEIEKHVEDWLDNVNNMVDEVSKVIEDNQQTNMKCFKCVCPNLKKRHQQSKKAAGKLKAVVALEQGGKFEKISYQTIPEEIWLSSIKGYEAFESRKSILKDILDASRNPDVNMVGIYGMGGVGKTMLAKEVARQGKEGKLFAEIVFVEVSHTPDIKKIQGAISDKLGLKFDEESESGRARKLYHRLKKEKNIVVILDNIWGSIDLEIVGIPFGNDHKGCKFLLTSRSRDALTNKMESQHNFCVEVLKHEDAWSLFKKIAGACTVRRDLQSLALDVTKACQGVPIAIVATARALKNKETCEWSNALRELTKPSSGNFEGTIAEVYSSIQLSYNHLESEELKAAFLLCSRLGCTYDASVQDLFRYGMGLGLFTKTNTMKEALDNIDTLISKLKASSLLLENPNNKKFAMHDVVRDVARSIAFRDHNVFTVANDVIPQNWIHEVTLKNCEAISLHDISWHPEEMICPQLKFFYMKNKNSFAKMPDNFFMGMPSLQVLHLIRMDLWLLPSSLACLVNLRTLSMEECRLGDIAIIGDLKKLELLSFRGSSVEKLPEEMHQLIGLRLLDLTNCFKLRIIPPNVISCLTQLEALYMGNTSIQWEVERLQTERSNASLEELKNLSHLTILEIHIPDAKLSTGLFSQKLERYKIFIGDNWDKVDWYVHYNTFRILKLKLNTCGQDGVIKQLKGITELHLYEVPGVRNVLYELDRKGFPELKHLNVQNNPHSLHIVNSSQSVSGEVLPALESLFLGRLVNLEKICNDHLGAKSFCQLRIMSVHKCHKLINIFSLSTDECLPELQEIEVTHCNNMQEILAIERQDDVNNTKVIDKIQISQLRSVILRCLPELKSFCSEVKPPSLLLFNEKVVFPNLETLEISEICVEKIWHNQLRTMSSCLQNLARLIIQGCDNLKELFSSSIVDSFVQLQYLEICGCGILQEMVVTEELREERRDRMVLLPKLNYLKMEALANLRRLYSGNYIEFPSLKELVIEKCPNLKAYIFDDKVGLPSLETMKISNMDNLKMIWHNQLANDSFRKLKSLKVKDCNKLLTVFPSSMRGRYLWLEFLRVRKCDSVEEIFDLQGINFEERHTTAATQLKKLYIKYLPNLKHIWYKEPHRMVCFGNLQTVKVSHCGSLKYLFSASVARSLLELEYLSVSHCKVEEIVVKEVAEEEAAARFLFPRLTSLKLRQLPEFRTFYPGRHTMEGPVLKKLGLYNCNKVYIFASELLRFHQPLFLIEKAFPCLEELGLDGRNITMIWQGQVPERFINRIKVLKAKEDESTVLPLGIIQNFHNLEKLSLSFSTYEEISSHGAVQNQAVVAKMKMLVLKELQDLKHMCKQDSNLDFIFRNLEVLEVTRCHSLINLMPPSKSFQNLTILEVKGCNRLINVVTSSTAKSLVQLVKMKIQNCKMMKEIVANEGDETEGNIIFSKLKSLSLNNLPRLISFSYGNDIFTFPSLEQLIVNECYNMKIFSQGALSTPMLQKLKIDKEWNERCWEIDLNTTIQQFHEKRNARISTHDHGDSSSHHYN